MTQVRVVDYFSFSFFLNGITILCKNGRVSKSFNEPEKKLCISVIKTLFQLLKLKNFWTLGKFVFNNFHPLCCIKTHNKAVTKGKSPDFWVSYVTA